jgi:hypothetical protein
VKVWTVSALLKVLPNVGVLNTATKFRVSWTQGVRWQCYKKLTAFWDIVPYGLVEFSGRFIALMMDAVRTSETSVYFNETTRRYIPEGCHLQTRRRENMVDFPIKNVCCRITNI